MSATPLSGPARICSAEQAIEIFRTARRSQGIMQRDLAQRIHVSVDSIRRWEQSRRGIPTEDLLAIADALDHDVVVIPRQRNRQALIPTAPLRALSATETARNPSAGIPGPPKAAAGESGASTAVECWHCRKPRRGYATTAGMPLCHPDTGPDCYRLVVIHNHPMPCDCTEETR